MADDGALTITRMLIGTPHPLTSPLDGLGEGRWEEGERRKEGEAVFKEEAGNHEWRKGGHEVMQEGSTD